MPSWIATVDDRPVARTGEMFGQLLQRLATKEAGQTIRLVGGRVEGIETVAGPGRPDGPGRYGFWTGTRIAGPITLDQTHGPTLEEEGAP